MTHTEFRAARIAMGFSVAEMAARLGVSPLHVRRMEIAPGKGAHRPVTSRTSKDVYRLTVYCGPQKE